MSEAKRYFINPIPDEGGALDELPNVICLDETPGITYYTYVRERTCRVERMEIDEFGRYFYLSCGHMQMTHDTSSLPYCPECGAKAVE